jgi:hypothetical protein
MKLLTIVGVSAMIVFGCSDRAITAAPTKTPAIPTVGIVNLQGKAIGAGCYFTFLNAKVKSNKSIIFYSGETTWMNLNGRDTQLKRISSQNTKKTSRDIYSVNNLRIRVDTKSLQPNASLNSQAEITISMNNRSKKIQAIGYCGC